MYWKLVVTAVVVALVVVVGFELIDYFRGHGALAEFEHDLKKLRQTINSLALSAPGSSSICKLNVPEGTNVMFFDNIIQVTYADGSTKSYELEIGVSGPELGEGKHNLQLTRNDVIMIEKL
jgi:hypothetical protein